VGWVLNGNGISEQRQLRGLRLDAFQALRGEDVFAHPSCHRTPINGSVNYRVLTRARGRCECCGARLLLGKQGTNGPCRWTTSCR